MQPPLCERSDQALAQESQAGMLSSFEELVRRHEGGIYRFLARRCRQPADAEDLTQITFVTAYRAIQQYRSDHSFGAWLFTIARRKFIDHCRRASPESAADLVPEPADPNDPSTLLVRREEVSGLWTEARRWLPRAQFDALWLQYQDEMSIRDIAQVLRRTQISVKLLLFRARRTLLQRLPRGEAGSPMARPAAGASTPLHMLAAVGPKPEEIVQ